MTRIKATCIFGTRPEAIKMAPVVLALRDSGDFEVDVCATGQHRSMLDQVLSVFGIEPHRDLHLMADGQTLCGLASRAVHALESALSESKPDILLVQGDTTTAFCGALAGMYLKIPVGHVEAGLRTHNLLSPWPEEGNRRMISAVAALHFAPTEWSRGNLLREGVPEKSIWVTGNTVIDALRMASEQVKQTPPILPGLPAGLQPGCAMPGRRMVLITGHRRENFGSGFEEICAAVAELALIHPEIDFVYPVHLNPNVRDPVIRILGIPDACKTALGANENIHLLDPVDYLSFVALMQRSYLVLSDSGGVQEEAPSLGKPVLVMRDTTERPEAVEAGTVRLVGACRERIVSAVSLLLGNAREYQAMAHAVNPFGDGHAAERILEGLRAFFR